MRTTDVNLYCRTDVHSLKYQPYLRVEQYVSLLRLVQHRNGSLKKKDVLSKKI